jgi:hypothetical protein
VAEERSERHDSDGERDESERLEGDGVGDRTRRVATESRLNPLGVD